MAGSYNHCVEKPSGKLLVNEDLVQMIENLGDAYEAIEELYGMVWWFVKYATADITDEDFREQVSIAIVETARQGYQEGLEFSPGTDGHLSDDEEE